MFRISKHPNPSTRQKQTGPAKATQHPICPPCKPNLHFPDVTQTFQTADTDRHPGRQEIKLKKQIPVHLSPEPDPITIPHPSFPVHHFFPQISRFPPIGLRFTWRMGSRQLGAKGSRLSLRAFVQLAMCRDMTDRRPPSHLS